MEEGRRGADVKDMITAEGIIAASPCSAWPDTRVRETITEPISTIDLLRRDDIPAADRIWVATTVEGLSDRVLRLWACDCTSRALGLYGDPVDSRSTKAVEVARRYVIGEASDEELAAARAAAWDVTRGAVWAAAGAAARTAARAAAGGAARTVARAAAGAAVWAAARAAAGAAARAAAWAAEEEWQTQHLVVVIEREEQGAAP